MDKIIITINRECGSGGRSIAYLLGEKLGLKVYDRTILDSIAEQFDMDVDKIERVKAQKANWWDDFCRFYQQFGAASHTPSTQPEATPLSVYYAEARLLRELAEQESCIIIGRAGFHIFRDNPDAIHLLIIANRQSRIARVMKKQDLTQEEAEKTIDTVDRARDTFVKTVANTSRYDARNYDFVLNVSGMEPEKVASFLVENIRLRMEARE
ncbi:MAG: cytidylate kinase-like family protein [Bacteroidales bacterium]|nr:cytidylate kinase-like family protein [Bacteroidales bacterium]